jgi:hypothetical protein
MADPRLERARRLLRDSQAHLIAACGGLTEDQWRWRPDDATWSALDNVEHLAVVERGSARMLVEGMTHPEAADAPVREAAVLAVYDERMVTSLLGRTEKADAPDRVRPKGRFASGAEALANFNEWRTKLTAWADAPTWPPASKVAPHPRFGQIDGVQWMLFLGAHAERHVRQLADVLTALPRG